MVNKTSLNLKKVFFPWCLEYERSLRIILDKAVASQNEKDELVLHLLGIKKTLYMKSKSVSTDRNLTPSEYKKEIARFAKKIKEAKGILAGLYPDLESLKKHAPYTSDNITQELEDTPTPYLWMITYLDRIEFEATKTSHMRNLANMYYNQKRKIHLEHCAIFPAATFCSRAGIKISSAERSHFHAICRWLLSDPDSENDNRGNADLRKFIQSTLKNWRLAYKELGG